MSIANPIYDVVFKYLLDDAEIARELLSTILGVEIESLEVKPQETLVKNETGDVKIFHLDFKAVINLENGEQKTVLIELQKARKSHDILRFRKYLGENYIKEELRANEIGELESYAIEIVTIYILGFKLKGVDVPVLKVNRRFTDAITNEEVSANDDFVTKLTHESYTIQIPRLKHDQRNKLEEVLEVFSQDFVTDNLRILEFNKKSKNALVNKMIKRLSKAAADDEIRRKMDAEEMMARLMNQESKEYVKQIEILNVEKEQIIAEKEQLLIEKESEKAEKEQLLIEKESEKEKFLRIIEDLQKQLDDKK